MSPDIAKCPGAERMTVTSQIWTADLKRDEFGNSETSVLHRGKAEVHLVCWLVQAEI